MKRIALLLIGMGMLVSGWAYAVEPAYHGDLGNAEEPALRPYKWIYRGAKALVYQTGKSLQRGNMKTPVLGTADVGRGLRRGTVEGGECLFRGAVGAPVPQDKQYYKELHTANGVLESDPLLENSSDFLFSWYLYPAQKVNEYKPIENDYKVQVREEKAKEIRTARKEARPKKVTSESKRKQAQRHYVPDRVDAGSKRAQEGRGNLLKLAR